jgi:hypothetical protein
MKTIVLLLLSLCCCSAWAQSFEWVDRQENFQTGLTETLRIPIKIKNTTDKVQYYVIRKAAGDLGGTQKGYFCIDKNCFEPAIEEFSKRVEPGETLSNLYYVLETGLVAGQNNVRFEVCPRGVPGELVEHHVNISIDEKSARTLVFKSKDITIHDVYPNPASDQAFVDYQIHNEMIKAKVVIHNILGSPVGNYDLPTYDLKVKIPTEELPSGVYFYTVYLDNDGVLTRKLIVRK